MELNYWLALLHAPYVGTRIFYKIVNLCDSLQEFFTQGEDTYKALGLHPQTIDYVKNPDWRAVEADLIWEKEHVNHFIITIEDETYPLLLKEIASPPPILFIQGDKTILNSPQVAMIGARRASPSGQDIACNLAAELAATGLVITSGLALGIDTAAHKGALKANTTIAVTGTGLDTVYPKSNHFLAEEIQQRGALISEFPIGTLPHAKNFPRRNRLISGMTLGTIVIEANIKSGSLITANYALEQGREVFAVPGSIKNPRTRGCHWLIQQGAKLVQNANDVLEELPFFHSKSPNQAPKTDCLQNKRLEDDHLKLLECVGYEPTKVDCLVERSHFSVQKVASILVDLELANFVCSTISGYMRV